MIDGGRGRPQLVTSPGAAVGLRLQPGPGAQACWRGLQGVSIPFALSSFPGTSGLSRSRPALCGGAHR